MAAPSGLCVNGLCEAYDDVNGLSKKLIIMENLAQLGAGSLIKYELPKLSENSVNISIDVAKFVIDEFTTDLLGIVHFLEKQGSTEVSLFGELYALTAALRASSFIVCRRP